MPVDVDGTYDGSANPYESGFGFGVAYTGARLTIHLIALAFPLKYWAGPVNYSLGKDVPYDFIGNRERVIGLVELFKRSVAGHRDLLPPIDPELAIALGTVYSNAATLGTALRGGGPEILETPDMEEDARWGLSAFTGFYRQGLKLQKEGKHPKVLIMW